MGPRERVARLAELEAWARWIAHRSQAFAARWDAILAAHKANAHDYSQGVGKPLRMVDREHGFTLIELAIVCVILGTLAAIALPAYQSMVDRAREGHTKANMHAQQLAVEGYAVDNEAIFPAYAEDAPDTCIVNPFTGLYGPGASFETRADMDAGPSELPGIVSYAQWAGQAYNIKGYGKHAALTLILSNGERVDATKTPSETPGQGPDGIKNR